MLAKRSVPGRSKIHGWGLFAKEDIPSGALIDETPLMVLDVVPEGMSCHVYNLPSGRCGVPLGDGVLCNSADDPNARFNLDWHRKHLTVSLIALRSIFLGEEITIAYDSAVRSLLDIEHDLYERDMSPSERRHQARILYRQQCLCELECCQVHDTHTSPHKGCILR